MAVGYLNPLVAVPVGAVELINRAIDLLGEELVVMVSDQEIDGLGHLENAFVAFECGDVPVKLAERLWAAAEDINFTIGNNPIVGVRGGDNGQPLELFIRAA